MDQKTLRKPCLEDLHAAILAAMTRLDEDNIIDGSDPKHDMLFDNLSEVLEKYFNYPDYSNYN